MSFSYSHLISKKVLPFLLLAIFLLGLLSGNLLHGHKHEEYFDSIKVLRTSSSNFPLVFPILGTESLRATYIGEYSDLENRLEETIKEEVRNGNILEGSVYVRDLGRSLWVGVNEDKKYAPASLFKLPIAIAIYKTAEVNPSLLQENFIYTQEIAALNFSAPSDERSSLVIGKSYSFDELVKLMLIDSDNGAKDLLASKIDPTIIDQLFKDAGVEAPRLGETYTISPKTYAFFFRMLYNGSYLGRANSQKLLEIFTKTNFKDGIVAGVKKNVLVAHKFGIFDLEDKENGREVIGLHDCGIVYNEDSPYLICVMTKGFNENSLKQVIAKLSAITYEEIEKEAKR
jgi:hypothetical protein